MRNKFGYTTLYAKSARILNRPSMALLIIQILLSHYIIVREYE